ncbi:MAG TPA: efflux RND transporter periplasmic adaptor subunit [Longimicrobium sp.]|nr:efflux RND transporter periplasmic adaptor subunit [Longimicrobium sp.]
MKRMRIIAAVAVLVLVTAGFWLLKRADAAEAPAFRFAAVERGDLEAAVSATGTLGAVTTVQVGTQVSGQVSAIYADFNDRVRKGQLIARIDPTLQEQAVRDAQAGLERAQAELAQAEREYERNRLLHESKIVTDAEFSGIQSSLAVARAGVKSARVTLDRARQNLSYTSIYAPIDGIVVERNVDVGQTVAASLSAPQLFLIAQDLSRMQILASVDESDIGLIREGQKARFTVQAYADEAFTGTVKQVRLQSTTTENVVNYTAVVEVDNPGGKLLPGMTATVDFLTGAAEDVLVVPNAALRFRPTPEMLAQIGSANGVRVDSARVRAAAGQGAQGGSSASRSGGAQGQRSANAARLWYVGADGKPAVARVRTGLTDGQSTEVRGAALKEGMQVIVGVSTGGESASAASGSPFGGGQTQRTGGPPGPPGGF